ncbi:MAG: hypothetical protein IT574_02990, partial [Candidatus Aureabacteria bacterium]|nr:hypothetical protein [Candidatus Auribacterota bacterium]
MQRLMKIVLLTVWIIAAVAVVLIVLAALLVEPRPGGSPGPRPGGDEQVPQRERAQTEETLRYAIADAELRFAEARAILDNPNSTAEQAANARRSLEVTVRNL